MKQKMEGRKKKGSDGREASEEKKRKAKTGGGKHSPVAA